MTQNANGVETGVVPTKTEVAPQQERRANPDSAIRFSGITHWFHTDSSEGLPPLVLKDVDFEVPEGQFASLVGKSGCGKTTLLNIAAGLIQPAMGGCQVRIDGEVVTRPNRAIGYMFARDALLPWRTLQSNVELGLEFRGETRHARRERAQELLRMVGLAAAVKSYPSQLSHGMRQRGNLARMLATDPQLLLMDEPFGALDAQTKEALEEEFVKIWERGPGRSVLFITHDLVEAALISDRILVMGTGYVYDDIVVPFARPRSLHELRYDAKFNDFVRRLRDGLAAA